MNITIIDWVSEVLNDTAAVGVQKICQANLHNLLKF